LDAAVGVSVPFELRLVADRINQGFSRIYQRHLLKKLQKMFYEKKQALQGQDKLPQALENLEKWDCFWTFDEQVTAPLHGFSGVHAYYRQSSCRQYLAKIDTQTLIIHAKDDPFMSTEVLPSEEELSASITLELSERGGHVGFISGEIPGKPEYWLDGRISDYLEDLL
jgi:predicted alpha/beta-fold hydrolase